MVCRYLNAGGMWRALLFVVFALFCPNSIVLAYQTPTPQQSDKIARAKLTYAIIGKEGGYGYDIFADGRMLIHQPTMPGVEGNSGFKSKADSEKVAELVIGKLKKGEMPPAVTKEELRKLKVIN